MIVLVLVIALRLACFGLGLGLEIAIAIASAVIVAFPSLFCADAASSAGASFGCGSRSCQGTGVPPRGVFCDYRPTMRAQGSPPPSTHTSPFSWT